MALIGRGASALLVLAVMVLAIIGTIFPDLAHIGSVHVVDWVGLAIYVCTPVVWISAILHWALHFPREGPRVLWGLIVVLGFVPGSIAYWFWGARLSAPSPSNSGTASAD